MTAKELLEESDKPSLMRGVEKLSPKVITEFCEQGDELACSPSLRKNKSGFVLTSLMFVCAKAEKQNTARAATKNFLFIIMFCVIKFFIKIVAFNRSLA